MLVSTSFTDPFETGHDFFFPAAVETASLMDGLSGLLYLLVTHRSRLPHFQRL